MNEQQRRLRMLEEAEGLYQHARNLLNDSDWMKFIEERGVHIYPQRRSKHGPIMHWFTATPTPFIQTSGNTLKEALVRLYEALDLHGTD
jgi:hypothetical protein